MPVSGTFRRIAAVDLRIPSKISPEAKDLIIKVRNGHDTHVEPLLTALLVASTIQSQ